MEKHETNHWKYDGSTQTYQTKLGQGRPVEVVRKTADQTNNSNTLVDDTELKLAVRANTVWWLRLFIRATSPAAEDMKWGWTLPSGATIEWSELGDFASGSFLTPNTTGTEAVSTAGGVDEVNIIEALVIVGSTAGTIQFQWAQLGGLGGSPTTVYANSVLLGIQCA